MTAHWLLRRDRKREVFIRFFLLTSYHCQYRLHPMAKVQLTVTSMQYSLPCSILLWLLAMMQNHRESSSPSDLEVTPGWTTDAISSPPCLQWYLQSPLCFQRMRGMLKKKKKKKKHQYLISNNPESICTYLSAAPTDELWHTPVPYVSNPEDHWAAPYDSVGWSVVFGFWV